MTNINKNHPIKPINLKVKIGITMLTVNVFVFLFLVSLPFFDFSIEKKLALTGIIFIVMKILFWGGLFLIGKELVQKFKEKFPLLKLIFRNNRKNKT